MTTKTGFTVLFCGTEGTTKSGLKRWYEDINVYLLEHVR